MSLESHLESLKGKHAVIDDKLREAELQPSTDSLEVINLKREKLSLKDEIQRLSS